MVFTKHALQRMKERGITEQDLNIVLTHGYMYIEKNSSIVTYTLTKVRYNKLSKKIKSEKLFNLKVVMDLKADKIITLFNLDESRSQHAHQNFKINWQDGLKLTEKEAVYLGRILNKILPVKLREKYLIQKDRYYTKPFYLREDMVYNKTKFYSLENPQLDLDFSYILKLNRKRLISQNICPYFFEGYLRFEDFFKKLSTAAKNLK